MLGKQFNLPTQAPCNFPQLLISCRSVSGIKKYKAFYLLYSANSWEMQLLRIDSSARLPC